MKRRWPTWALVATIIVAGVIGMIVGYIPVSSTNRADAGGSRSGPAFPGAGRGSVSEPGHTTTTGTGRPGVAAHVATTTLPPTSTSARTTTTTIPTTTTSTTLPPMTTVVLETAQTSGPASTPEFTISRGPYEVGFAFECQSAPASTQSFTISVVTPSGAVPSPVFSGHGSQGSGTRVVARTGQQKLEVRTAAACVWVLKVVAP